MKKLIAVLLVSSMSLPVYAQNTTSSTKEISLPDGPAVISPLQKGQSAPFSGVLFSPRAAASIATDVSSFPTKLKIEVAAAVAKAEAHKDFIIDENNSKCKADKGVLEAHIASDKRNIEQLQIDLNDVRNAAPSRGLWFGLGAAGGVVFALLTAFVVGRIAK